FIASFKQPVVFGGSLYFVAEDAGNGRQVYRTDGGSAGAVQVSSLADGNDVRLTATGTGPGDARLYYVSDRGVPSVPGPNDVSASDQEQVFRTDGTNAGTPVRYFHSTRGGVVVSDPTAGPLTLIAAGGQTFFAAYDPIHGFELWKETTPPKAQLLAVGAGTVTQVNAYDAATGDLKYHFVAYPGVGGG